MKKTFTILASLLSLGAWAQIPSGGLVAFYPFNGDYKDYSGNNYHLTERTSGVTYTSDHNGYSNKAITINADNGLINSTAAIYPSASSFTIGYWIKVPAPNNTYPTAVELGETIYCRYLMNGTRSTSTAQLGYYNNGTDKFEMTYSSATTHTGWHHYAVVYDHTNKNAYIYVDGTLYSSIKASIANVPLYNIGLRVGTGTNSGTFNSIKNLNGSIDELGIYNRALNGTEITQLMTGCSNFVQPLGGNYRIGERVVLKTKAGTATSYQWMKNGVEIQGATNDSLVFPSFSVSDEGSYTANINTSACGILKSDTAKLYSSLGTTPIACYNFENPSPGNESMSALNANIYQGSMVADRNSVNQGAISFTGNSSSYAMLPNTTKLKRQLLTIALWVKPEGAGSYIIFAKNTQTADFEGLALVANTSNKFSLVKINPVVIKNSTISGGSYTLNNWTHVAVTVSNDSLKLYQNGILVAQAKADFPINYDPANSFVIAGSNQLSFPYPFKGAIDDLKFFDNPLKASEIMQLYSTSGSCVVTDVNDLQVNSTNVFPNPTKDVLNTNGYAAVYDLLGNKVAEGTNRIDLNEIENGIYLVKSNNQITKIIKE